MVDTDLAVTVSYQNAFSLFGKQQGGELYSWVGWAHYGWIQTKERYKNTQTGRLGLGSRHQRAENSAA